MPSLDVSIVSEFLIRYGEKAYYVLKTALEISEEYKLSGKYFPGDFDSKGLIKKLRERGIRYNPTQLLRLMEREYGIIETTYKSATQHWWSFTNREAVTEALRIYEGGEEIILDPEVSVIDLQVKLLDLGRIIRILKALKSKLRLTDNDRRIIKDIIIHELPDIALVAKNAMKYGDRYKDFLAKFRLIIKLAEEVIIKMKLSSRLGIRGAEEHKDMRFELSNESV